MTNLLDANVKCRLCGCRLNESEDDDFSTSVCCSCSTRPEAKRLDVGTLPQSELRKDIGNQAPARGFTPAEKALIRKVHGYMPTAQLLSILNERLICDLGPDAGLYTLDQLTAEIGDLTPVTPAGGHDWGSLRKLLAKARRDGLLELISEQTINDFAVVFSLNAKQVLNLKDIVLPAKEM
ncbi:hypothetical protein [Pusillimonas sp. T2]|uniref:hypothetical protein n=1 Tax=Pusillimonas sp. T2 TaxID=1548123 RepID=UPI00117A42E5|nr:hypothetical protein [Pusillimonas sp. T2]